MTPSIESKYNHYYSRHCKYLRLQGLQPKTIDAYSRAIRRIADYFNGHLDDLSQEQLLNYFHDLLERLSWSAVKLDLYGLKFFYTHVLAKPWIDIPMIKPPRCTRIPDIVTVEEAQQLFMSTRKLSYRVFYFTIYSLGLRLDEGLNLAVGDIDASRMRVHIRNAKGIEQQLIDLPKLADNPPEPVKELRNPHRTKNQQTALHQALYGVMGVDLTSIPTIGIETVLILASEIGADLSRFPDEANFCSWLNVAPPTCISGGKRLHGQKPHIFNRAGQALRQAALNARNSQSFIGASHRARLARMDGASAIKATAHQLARLVYAMLTKGQPYVEKGIEAFEVRAQDRQLKALQKKAQKLGLELVAMS